jgi:peptidoglycan/xylan/chitin deacetylase (PgdA/CDA1 family)
MEPQPVLRAKRTFALHIPVLMYHRIVPYADATGSLRGLIVPPSVFAGQLDALQRSGWHTITAAQLADDLAAGITPTPKTFVLTIDDGWGDGYTYAMPILAAHGFVGTFYVIAGRIDSGSFLTSAQLRDLVAAGDEIGDHTMDHVALEHQGPTRLAYEIDAAAATIASATGQWPTTLAYPTGSFDMTTEHAVQACAPMKMAVIEGQATYETWSTRFQIPRLKVTADMTPGALLAVMTNPPLPPIAKSK